eukprot:Opistho-2@77805
MVLEYASHGDLRQFLWLQTDILSLPNPIAASMCRHCARNGTPRQVPDRSQVSTRLSAVSRDLAARNCMVVAGPRAPNPFESGWKISSKAQVIIKVADMGLSRDTAAGDYYVAKTRRKLPVKWSVQYRTC